MSSSDVVIRPIQPEETHELRHSVLWPDKPRAFVQLDEDAQGVHFGAFLKGELVSVISLFESNGVARFRKFATRADCQGKGIGTALLHHVIQKARLLKATQLWCDARLSAASFYQRFGMQPEGEIFYKGPIAYSRYVMAL